jgi:multidrug resistance efflux pump
MTPKKCDDHDKTKFMNFVDVRTFFMAILEEKEKLINARFDAVDRTMAATKEASERAVERASATQEDYNISHNDLQRQMRQEAETFISRREWSLAHENLRQEIQNLRENQISQAGKESQIADQRNQRHFGIETVLSIVAVVVALAVLLLRLIVH